MLRVVLGTGREMGGGREREKGEAKENLDSTGVGGESGVARVGDITQLRTPCSFRRPRMSSA